MGDVVNFPVLLDSDLGRELIVDCVRFAEGLLDEAAVRKKPQGVAPRNDTSALIWPRCLASHRQIRLCFA